jgi:hypothetical protein
MIKAISQIAAHPEFVGIVREIEAGRDQADRTRIASVLATPREFAKRGIPMPAGFRVTTRYFEKPGARVVDHLKVSDVVHGPPPGNEPGMTACASVGLVVCVSVGGDFDADTAFL